STNPKRPRRRPRDDRVAGPQLHRGARTKYDPAPLRIYWPRKFTDGRPPSQGPIPIPHFLSVASAKVEEKREPRVAHPLWPAGPFPTGTTGLSLTRSGDLVMAPQPQSQMDQLKEALARAKRPRDRGYVTTLFNQPPSDVGPDTTDQIRFEELPTRFTNFGNPVR